ncbi:helix-turn-helix domain-containing protein [Novosphingobium sp. B-7]|uniref:helix-turn-helix domain-containing protein n=1 Tax=Novosphingobium sp. B-7 TaxID=1298855 RepID=UPI000429BD61|nr:helix-turn-helix domain-containing protein [Novosphingobium sp. B-7]
MENPANPPPKAGDTGDHASARLAEEIARVRAVLAASRSAVQLRLFDYLAARSGDARAPKEIEIAHAVFGGDESTDAAADSGVRVYVHRLRKRLEDHYRGQPGARLVIPKGEYRLVLAEVEAAQANAGFTAPDLAKTASLRAPAIAPPPVRFRRMPPGAVPALLGLALCCLAIAAGLAVYAWPWSHGAGGEPDDERLRNTALWRNLGAGVPVLVVAGDAYAAAETGDQRNVQRMILDPRIASREELGQHIRSHPDQFYRLYDFDLHFTPVPTALAAWNVEATLPHESTGTRRSASIVPASALTPALQQGADIVYVGHLADMGTLAAPLAAASSLRFDRPGAIVDPAAARVWQASLPAPDNAPRVRDAVTTDYGYLASLTAPGGRALLVIAGLGDVATAQLAGLATSAQALGQIAVHTGNRPHFEAVFAIDTRDGIAVSRRLLLARALR